MEERSKGFLYQETLKLIACVIMLLDHFAAVIVPRLPFPHMAQLYYTLRIIGRIAFPIYAFLLAEGMRRTKNPGKYILRLGIGILLAELPFDLMVKGGIDWQTQSVMVTLTLGAVMILCMQKVPKEWMKTVVIVPFLGAAEFACSDYGAWGILMIAIFALTDRLWIQAVCITAVNWMCPSVEISVFGFAVSIQLFAALAMIPIACYSGVKLTRSRALQWGFYLFYPVHMLALWVILGLIC